MKRKKYISNDELSLAEYRPEDDDCECYECWQDSDTQNGYNYKIPDSYEEFCNRPQKSRFLAVIIQNKINKPIGIVSLSPEGEPPDLAIMIYKPYRGKGYGKNALYLAARFIMDEFDFDCLYAGCYETNTVSLKMLKDCGFTRHPDGDTREKHYLTGEPIVQYDFVLNRHDCL